MIQLNVTSLLPATLEKLDEYQQELSSIGDYTQQVRKAEGIFKKYNRVGNVAFDDVKDKLTTMCCGAIRCQYCEDSEADSIEHHAPKHLYPEQCFRWDNYLYACSKCNRSNLTKYPVFRHDTGAFYNIPQHPKYKEGEVLVQPPAGKPVLLNPRFDNPLDFLFLDIHGSFKFAIWADSATQPQEYKRAEETLSRLKLNRPALTRARKMAYIGFINALRCYIQELEGGHNSIRLASIKEGIQEAHHQTVWQEMIRQYQQIAELNLLFSKALEALTW